MLTNLGRNGAVNPFREITRITSPLRHDKTPALCEAVGFDDLNQPESQQPALWASQPHACRFGQRIIA